MNYGALGRTVMRRLRGGWICISPLLTTPSLSQRSVGVGINKKQPLRVRGSAAPPQRLLRVRREYARHAASSGSRHHGRSGPVSKPDPPPRGHTHVVAYRRISRAAFRELRSPLLKNESGLPPPSPSAVFQWQSLTVTAQLRFCVFRKPSAHTPQQPEK